MSYLSKLTRSIIPYTAGEQPQDMKYVKINTNENPYPPCPKVRKILDTFNEDKLKLYPDPNNTELANALAKKHGVSFDNIFIGNGSDEVLALCFPTFFDQNGAFLAYADITYSFYKVWAKMFGINSKIIPLTDDFKIDIEDYKKLDDSVKGIIICNPNAPTSLGLGRLDLLEIIQANPDKIVIVDEAYADFSVNSIAGFVKDYKNLLVVRTFSKSYSLANIRCGYAIGDEELISGLKTIKNSFNSYTVNSLTEKIALAALEDNKYFAENIDKITTQREDTADALRELGFEVLESASNFLFAKHNKMAASEVYYRLKENGVLVRHFKSPRIDNYVRITIGTKEQMNILIKKLKLILDK